MKKLRYILVVACLFIFASCSVFGSNSDRPGSGHSDHPGIGHTEHPGSVNSPIVGNWRWIRTTGGFAGVVITPDSVGHESHTIFNAKNTFSVFVDDTLVKKGNYILKKEDGKTVISYQNIRYFPPRENKPSFQPKQWVKFRGRDTLVLMDQCYDCYITTFVRAR